MRIFACVLCSAWCMGIYMNIIAVDDEELALSALNNAIYEALPNVKPACFRKAEDAIVYAEQTTVDVAFLDVQMRGMDGLTLAKKLKSIRPNINIVFVTGYSEYLEDAFKLYASGYVRKPVRAKRILRELTNLRYPLKERVEPEIIKALGPYTFDHAARRVYCNGRDAALSPKEYQLFCLFAGNSGVLFTPEELFERVWGDDPIGSADKTVRVHISGIRKKLDMSENGNITIKNKRDAGYYLELDL